MLLSCYQESRYHLYNCVCVRACVRVGACEIYNVGPCCVDHIVGNI